MALDGVAEMLLKTVKEESEIDAAVASVEGLITSIQGSMDQLRGENSELKKKLEVTPKTPEQEPTGATEAINALTAQITALQASFQAIQTQNAHATRMTQAREALMSMGVDDSRKGFVDKAIEIASAKIGDADTVEDVTNKIKTEFDSLCTLSGVDGYVPKDASGGSAGDFNANMKKLYDGLVASGEITK